MNVAIIGGGASGIISAKLLRDEKVACDVYETANQIGGTWVYTEDSFDAHGLPTGSSMYKDLRTNLPKEVMEFSTFHYKNAPVSFISSNTVLQYLQEFADTHHIHEVMKLEHLVQNVRPTGDKWTVTVTNLQNKETFSKDYDAVFVCNGHYSVPRYPGLEGEQQFKGLQMHSHFFRRQEVFTGMKVLIIGIGPSGQDISFLVAQCAHTVFVSCHSVDYEGSPFPSNVSVKPDIEKLNENSVLFKDGSCEEIDAILYCTGYQYSYPFLDSECEIEVRDNYVAPLYKQIVSIKHPTMFFIGLPVRTFIFPLLEVQALSAIQLLLKRVELPSEQKMTEDMVAFERKKRELGVPMKHFHVIKANVREYVNEVVQLGNVPPIPDVIFKMFERCSKIRKKCLDGYRQEIYEPLSETDFIVRNALFD